MSPMAIIVLIQIYLAILSAVDNLPFITHASEKDTSSRRTRVAPQRRAIMVLSRRAISTDPLYHTAIGGIRAAISDCRLFRRWPFRGPCGTVSGVTNREGRARIPEPEKHNAVTVRRPRIALVHRAGDRVLLIIIIIGIAVRPSGCRKGDRPEFIRAAGPSRDKRLSKEIEHNGRRKRKHSQKHCGKNKSLFHIPPPE